jgi:hypothetical protein
MPTRRVECPSASLTDPPPLPTDADPATTPANIEVTEFQVTQSQADNTKPKLPEGQEVVAFTPAQYAWISPTEVALADAVSPGQASGQLAEARPESKELKEQEKQPARPAADGGREGDDARASRRSSRVNSRPSPVSAEHYEQPFVEGAVRPSSDEYGLWNKAIFEHCLLSDTIENEEVYLTITPRVLASAFAEVGGGILGPDEAQLDFTNAVSRMYHAIVLPHSRKLQVLRRCGGGGLPECGAFLALSVLAAWRMRTDDEMTASAYYKRLEELLRCGFSGAFPRGFDPDEFEGLWVFSQAWLEREQRRKLAMPASNARMRRFVAFPLTHVPLRQVDIERLPEFFEWAGYEAGQRVPVERIDADLSKWILRAAFTRAGMDSLADERRRAVLVQVAHELESWDGSITDARGRRAAPVEVFLHWERRIPFLSYLPRRPDKFPAVFDDGIRVIDAGQDGWYEPIPIAVEDGVELLNGFSWEADANGSRVALRRAGAHAIALAPSDFDGPISHAGLLLGVSGAALCRDDLVVPAKKYLESVTGEPSVRVHPPSMPSGWALFTGVNPVRRLVPPEGLEAFEIVTNIEIIPQGGLRVGKRWAWLVEAPPGLLVVGLGPGDCVTIDGKRVEVLQDGLIRDEGLLRTPGQHIVQAGRVARRLEIVDPKIAVADSRQPVAVSVDQRHVAALPCGWWTVIGSSAGEVSYAASKGWAQGALAFCPFEPVWALSYGLRHGAVVICLKEEPPPPKPLPSALSERLLQSMRAWADAVYNSNIRHPTFGSASQNEHLPKICAIWSYYAGAARQIKRKLRALHR